MNHSIRMRTRSSKVILVLHPGCLFLKVLKHVPGDDGLMMGLGKEQELYYRG